MNTFQTQFRQCWLRYILWNCSRLNTTDLQYIPRNMHTVFALLCFVVVIHWLIFPISIRLTSLALWQSNDCPSASKATLMNMDKYFMWIHYERLHNHNKAKHNKAVCIFLGIYCKCNDKWTLVHVMTWCHQAKSHYLSQCWYRSMSLHDVTWPQCHCTEAISYI